MTDTTETPARPRHSSLLYAMGRLEALQEAQAKEIATLPERIAAQMGPRLQAVEARVDGFEPRLRAVERWTWVHSGGLAVVLTAVTLGFGLVPHVHFKFP